MPDERVWQKYYNITSIRNSIFNKNSGVAVMNIAVINESSKYSGLGRYAAGLSIALSSQLVTIITDSQKKVEDYEGNIIRSRPLISLGSNWYLSHRYPRIFLRSAVKELKGLLKDTEIVHYSAQGIRKFPVGTKTIYTVHDLFGFSNNYDSNRRLTKLMKINLREILSADAIVTVSEYVKSKVIDLGYDGILETAYPFVSDTFTQIPDKAKLRGALGLPVDKKLVLSVSTIDPRKNLSAVYGTMKRLGSDYKLVRVGQIQGEGYSFIHVDSEKLNMIYNACDVLLFPSLDEGFGYPIAEAMRVGLPVVASDIQVFREVASDAAYLVKPIPENLSSAIKEIILDPNKYIESGLKRGEMFTFNRFRDRIHEIYRKLNR
jgi:glycosyltransferase involved in cell wall biosynthesis